MTSQRKPSQVFPVLLGHKTEVPPWPSLLAPFSPLMSVFWSTALLAVLCASHPFPHHRASSYGLTVLPLVSSPCSRQKRSRAKGKTVHVQWVWFHFRMFSLTTHQPLLLTSHWRESYYTNTTICKGSWKKISFSLGCMAASNKIRVVLLRKKGRMCD